MLLIDLVSSISHALPRLVADSAQRALDEEILGPNIGYAFFQPARVGPRGRLDGQNGCAWSSLESTTLGILGMGPIGRAVAEMAQRRFGADVVYHHSASAADQPFDAYARRQSFGNVVAAPVICIVLPWPEDIMALVERNKLAPVNSQNVLVVWRRSVAIERALLYLGQHYVESVQLRSLAEVACLSKFHLVRLFAATLGITPHRYQLLLRLSRAKAMLREGTGIADIAHDVGFADHSHLDRAFRLLIGMTPTEYQKCVEH